MSPLRVVPRRRRLRNGALVLTAVSVLVALDAQPIAAFASSSLEAYQESRPDYRASHGSWSTVDLPDGTDLHAIHAVQLYDGKVLLVAGSGNDQASFDAGTFTTVLWDPATGRTTTVPTPADLFCGGHAFLPDGNVLIAGGTRKYEVLSGRVTRAAGVMTVKNEDPESAPTVLVKGTRFRGPDGREYASTEQVVVPPAQKMDAMVHPSQTQLWVQAVAEGASSVVREGSQFAVEGIAAGQARDLYGVASSLTLDKQEYQGLTASYVFDVQTERYRKTGDLTRARWYPTLVSVKGGDVMAVSGLDRFGLVSPGNNEVYEPSVDGWNDRPGLFRYFPTYPSLLRTKDDDLFYSGSNAGYGPAKEGRQPGVWGLSDNSFAPVPGLRDADMTETSTSVLLAPAQDQKVLLAGGGGVGDSPRSTSRVDVVDLDDAPSPTWEPAPGLPRPARYVSSVLLPDDTTLLTGGSTGYRAAHESYTRDATVYDPVAGTMTPMAPPHVGRTYHSEALLLPDGRVLTMGGDPSFADEADKTPGTFEQRFEIWTPPYLERGLPRPTISAAPRAVQRGTTFHVDARAADGATITKARLLRPSAVTHQTDSEQRSVALSITSRAKGLDLSLDVREGITPSGWYMLFLTDDRGTPSVGRWVQVR